MMIHLSRTAATVAAATSSAALLAVIPIGAGSAGSLLRDTPKKPAIDLYIGPSADGGSGGGGPLTKVI